jgi:prepilin-type N-terminal cleavage/methylation domain-containing protein
MSILDVMPNKKALRGFTLIELLLVVTVLSLLAVAVFVGLNPAKRLIDTKNAKRTSDVDTVLSAIHESIIDNNGTYPTGLSAGMNEKQIGNSTGGVPTCIIATAGCSVTTNTDCVDLTQGAQNLSKYIKTYPIDPTTTYNASTSGYTVKVDSNGIVTVRACGAEGGSIIYASR